MCIIYYYEVSLSTSPSNFRPNYVSRYHGLGAFLLASGLLVPTFLLPYIYVKYVSYKEHRGGIFFFLFPTSLTSLVIVERLSPLTFNLITCAIGRRACDLSSVRSVCPVPFLPLGSARHFHGFISLPPLAYLSACNFPVDHAYLIYENPP